MEENLSFTVSIDITNDVEKKGQLTIWKADSKIPLRSFNIEASTQEELFLAAHIIKEDILKTEQEGNL
ncbi:hypothetical protein ACIQYS_14420 [Psychrobacillus sp. NPDC096426]|uniref:hypothetical protein n=1 Tax=Psychrobacillus sp. NPDC096426 TaxID=3364491 RepID=UPI00381160E6